MAMKEFDIKQFGLEVNPGEARNQLTAIANSAQEISDNINSFKSSFIEQLNTVWYTKVAEQTTKNICAKFNEEVVNKVSKNYNDLRDNYVTTVNALLSESQETVSKEIPALSPVESDWVYTADSTNILPTGDELTSFVNTNAQSYLQAISDSAQSLASSVSAAQDIIGAKEGLIQDLNTVKQNALNLVQGIKEMLIQGFKAEEAENDAMAAKLSERA